MRDHDAFKLILRVFFGCHFQLSDQASILPNLLDKKWIKTPSMLLSALQLIRQNFIYCCFNIFQGYWKFIQPITKAHVSWRLMNKISNYVLKHTEIKYKFGKNFEFLKYFRFFQVKISKIPNNSSIFMFLLENELFF